ncbi:MAG: tRNA uridine-5-carboxymethylaminomethyl(34) synthesis GTPase MnmE [Bacillota bacterium]
MEKDTIAAIATPLGEGGIGIVRTSGPASREIGTKLLRTGGKIPIFKPHIFQYGRFVGRSGEVIDEVMFVWMESPRSFTKEDVLEIHAHGGILVMKKILGEVLSCGARLALPGEFTKRAFLNGRIDLSQAEAVIDLIRAKCDAAAGSAIKQLDGALSKKLAACEERLYAYMAQLEAAIDFPEDEIPGVMYGEMEKDLIRIMDELDRLLETSGHGRILREGLGMVIIGRPNVGKSSLLNYFLQEERAIVTPAPGTTRDTIEETVNLEGIPLRITDTAGLRETDEPAERMGVEKARRCLAQAELVLFVLDSSEELTEEDRDIGALLKGRRVVAVLNKTDLPRRLGEDEVRALLPGIPVAAVSLLKGQGLECLKSAILKEIGTMKASGAADLILTNTRHAALLEQARQHLGEALSSIKQRLPEDLVAVDLKASLLSLGEVTGKTFTSELLDQIFSRFCIGK